MPFLQCDFHSNTLGLACSMNVLLPQSTGASQIGMDSAAGDSSTDRGWPVLYLLHGLSDDHTIWMRRTSIERYVAPLGLAVVMPAVSRSFYTDMTSGLNYWSFISEELPALCQSMFRISRRREDTFVAGLSMGGYGAFKLALRKPEQYAAAASLSGALDVARWIMADEDRKEEMGWIFGDVAKVANSDHDPLHLAEQLAASGQPRPKLYQCCGTEDILYEGNQAFRQRVEPLGFDLTYAEHEGKGHSWDYWDQTIQDVLDWLPLNAD